MTAPYVLIPGRHHVLTRFQARYLHELAGGDHPTLVWAVTSANHQNTRRNPVAANRREAAIELFSWKEGFRSLVVPIFDARPTDRFAEVTLKAIGAATGGLALEPGNCVVAVSTPSVIGMYSELGFEIAQLELDHPDKPLRAWQVLELCAAGDPKWRELAHPATVDVFERYALAEQVVTVMADPITGDEGSLTDTRNYRSYAASFEASAERKWRQAQPYVVPGRIVDIGCATGAVIELASREPELQESDLYGIEVAQHLYEECIHKKSQGVFANPNTFFFQRNILAGKVFPDASIDTSLSFALTHEIVSYAGGVSALRRFVETVFAQTAPGGVWINSDVCGPEQSGREVLLRFHNPGFDVEPRDLEDMSAEEVKAYLEGLGPAARFVQFAQDFPRLAGGSFSFGIVDANAVLLRLGDAMEFMTRYRYTDNWLSECHERFCTLAWSDWRELATTAGFEVDPRSGPWRNDWMVRNVFQPVAELYSQAGDRIEWPETHLFLVARRVGLT